MKRFAQKQVESFNYVKAISKKYETVGIPNFEDFKNESFKTLEDGMKINHAPLVTYVKYREFLIKLYKKLLEQKEDGKYQHEKILHNILFPTRTDSEDHKNDYRKHNLWLIDDRYAVYEYMSSDMKEFEIADAPYNKEDKRYDLFASYADPEGEERNIFIVELKQTAKPLSADNDPIGQIKHYVQRIINGKLDRDDGTRINATESTQYYGIVLCDIHNGYFKDFMISGHSLKKRPDGKSYHAVLLNERFFLEITDYDYLLDIAQSRNKIFIDILNNKY